MGERIKQLRLALGLTQQEFAEKLHVSRSNVATYEVGRSLPTPAVISLIISTFGVNDDWFNDGVGPMFQQSSRDTQIMEFVADAMKGESDNFKRRLLSVLSRLDEKGWVMLEKYLREIVGDSKED